MAGRKRVRARIDEANRRFLALAAQLADITAEYQWVLKNVTDARGRDHENPRFLEKRILATLRATLAVMEGR